jgi:hypothetical protein
MTIDDKLRLDQVIYHAKLPFGECRITEINLDRDWWRSATVYHPLQDRPLRLSSLHDYRKRPPTPGDGWRVLSPGVWRPAFLTDADLQPRGDRWHPCLEQIFWFLELVFPNAAYSTQWSRQLFRSHVPYSNWSQYTWAGWLDPAWFELFDQRHELNQGRLFH